MVEQSGDAIQAALLGAKKRDQEHRDRMVEAIANDLPATSLVGLAIALMMKEGGDIEKRMAAKIKAMIDYEMNQAGFNAHQLRQLAINTPRKGKGSKLLLPGGKAS